MGRKAAQKEQSDAATVGDEGSSKPRKPHPANVRESKKIRMAKRRLRICELYIQGRYMHEIAKEVGCSLRTVERDIAEQQEQWLKDTEDTFEQHRAREIAKLNSLERRYTKAWFRSLRPKVDETCSQTVKPGGPETKQEQHRKNSEGNPAFLAGIERCITQRCKLLGLDRSDRDGANGAGNGGGISVLIGVDAAMILGVKKDPRVIEAVAAPLPASATTPVVVAGPEAAAAAAATALAPVEDKEG